MTARTALPAPRQTDLFDAPDPPPDGFIYRPELIDPAEEADLARRLARLPFQPFDFHGHLAHRHVAFFGLRYDYASRKVRDAQAIPEWLMPLRDKVGAFAGQPAEAFVQVLINKYRPGAGIGWHRDKPYFETVVGVSLLSPCTFRFRRKDAATWARRSLTIAPRSAYLLSGDARHLWEHGIPPGETDRYSITFRTLADRG